MAQRMKYLKVAWWVSTLFNN